jgi:hypothetical protein
MRKNWTANNHGAMLISIPVKLIISHYNKEPNSDFIVSRFFFEMKTKTPIESGFPSKHINGSQ